MVSLLLRKQAAFLIHCHRLAASSVEQLVASLNHSHNNQPSTSLRIWLLTFRIKIHST